LRGGTERDGGKTGRGRMLLKGVIKNLLAKVVLPRSVTGEGMQRRQKLSVSDLNLLLNIGDGVGLWVGRLASRENQRPGDHCAFWPKRS